ncbi:hypothetical protein P9112_005562 [Eukaryota sp. TZLM1-RC]
MVRTLPDWWMNKQQRPVAQSLVPSTSAQSATSNSKRKKPSSIKPKPVSTPTSSTPVANVSRATSSQSSQTRITKPGNHAPNIPVSSPSRSPHSLVPSTSRSSVSPSTPARPLSHVLFAISAIQNPERAELRSKAMSLGARYSPTVTSQVTHLLCPISNTPKIREAQRLNVDFVLKPEWIDACLEQQLKVSEYRYLVDQNVGYSSDSSTASSPLFDSGSEEDRDLSDFVVD